MHFIGDTHGLRPVFTIVDKHKFQGQNLIHVGDFGLGFSEIGYDIKNLLLTDEMLLDTDNHLYVIRGNHDNPIFWDKSKGLNLPKFHNLHLVDDFEILTIEGKKILMAGGAISIDRIPRKDDTPYPTWWADEVFKYQRLKLEKQIKAHKTVDIVVTHTAPDFVHPTDDNVEIVNHYHSVEKIYSRDLKSELRTEREEVTELYNDLTLHYKIKPSHWFYGHFHSTKKRTHDGVVFKLLNINEVYEIPQINNQVSES
jgi:DNA repair exonuclease SbcCD nuclease subunit